MIQYKCAKCGMTLESPDSMIGQQDTCPLCRSVTIVPEPFNKKPLIIGGIAVGVALVGVLTFFLITRSRDSSNITPTQSGTKEAAKTANPEYAPSERRQAEQMTRSPDVARKDSLRFDGLYCDNPGTRHRFYLVAFPDGTILETATSSSPEQVAKWLDGDLVGFEKGRYRVGSEGIVLEGYFFGFERHGADRERNTRARPMYPKHRNSVRIAKDGSLIIGPNTYTFCPVKIPHKAVARAMVKKRPKTGTKSSKVMPKKPPYNAVEFDPHVFDRGEYTDKRVRFWGVVDKLKEGVPSVLVVIIYESGKGTVNEMIIDAELKLRAGRTPSLTKGSTIVFEGRVQPGVSFSTITGGGTTRSHNTITMNNGAVIRVLNEREIAEIAAAKAKLITTAPVTELPTAAPVRYEKRSQVPSGIAVKAQTDFSKMEATELIVWIDKHLDPKRYPKARNVWNAGQVNACQTPQLAIVFVEFGTTQALKYRKSEKFTPELASALLELKKRIEKDKSKKPGAKR